MTTVNSQENPNTIVLLNEEANIFENIHIESIDPILNNISDKCSRFKYLQEKSGYKRLLYSQILNFLLILLISIASIGTIVTTIFLTEDTIGRKVIYFICGAIGIVTGTSIPMFLKYLNCDVLGKDNMKFANKFFLLKKDMDNILLMPMSDRPSLKEIIKLCAKFDKLCTDSPPVLASVRNKMENNGNATNNVIGNKIIRAGKSIVDPIRNIVRKI